MLEIAEPGAAIFLLDGNPVQAERADLRPEIARELVALVDFGGARRDLVARKVLHGLADRVRGLAEIEIEHPLRVGDHGRGLRRHNASREKPYPVPARLSREMIRYRIGTKDAPVHAAKSAKLALAGASPTGCNSLQTKSPSGPIWKGKTGAIHGRNDRSGRQVQPGRRARTRLVAAACRVQSRRSRAVSLRHALGRISTACARRTRSTTART